MKNSLKKSFMTALKYALWTGAGALVTFLLTNVVPNIGGNYLVVVPVIAMILKSLATFFATQAANSNKDETTPIK